MIRWLIIWLCLATAAVAQDQPARAALSVDAGRGTLNLSLDLPAVTPYRVFTLDDPWRLVVDLQNALIAAPLSLTDAPVAAVADIRTVRLRPDWGRLIVELARPMVVDSAAMATVGDSTQLRVQLRDSAAAEFAARAGPPPDPDWDAIGGYDPASIGADRPYVVVIDPAHGGADPGLVAGGLKEGDVTLLVAQELAYALTRAGGITVVLTRQGDQDVPILERLATATQAGADLLISFHADGGDVVPQAGAAVQTGDPAMATADPAGGPVAAVLSDLARTQTGSQARRIADALAASLARAGVPMRADPQGQAARPILRNDRFPSVVVVLGNLAQASDHAFLSDPANRLRVTDAIRETVLLLAR